MINKSAGVRNVFSSAHIERGRGSSSAELIYFGLQRFCLSCCSTPIAGPAPAKLNWCGYE